MRDVSQNHRKVIFLLWGQDAMAKAIDLQA